ncbi:YlbF family regulator [Humisphaera borealis]|uniref:YlbF family regulator n=1 Tax=Humisphaera borealis TaxID=2807512 RepID=A0A7M2WY55_9BACT|nr:YlbF family regulator [Humisphaera borealis]QOV89450.1 YlbF family regulator [Humisphaera borealis]
MPVDTQQILSEAEKLGQLVATHPAVARFKDAQKAVAGDPEAGRLLQEFDRTLDALGRQEQAGMPVTDAQRMQLESLQTRISSHLKIKALNLAQVEFVDILRKVTQTIQAQVQGTGGGAAQPAPAPASKILM